MSKDLSTIFSTRELLTLASIVQVGDATYRDLIEEQRMFGHQFFNDTRGRIRTKLVQMQAEIESHDPGFPFEYYQRSLINHQLIPELRNKSVIIHIFRSSDPGVLPYKSRYKINLSNRNYLLQRQLIIEPTNSPPYREEELYVMLVFGGKETTFAVLQFPEPGYIGVAESILLPPVYANGEKNVASTFERKKATLREEFMKHRAEGGAS